MTSTADPPVLQNLRLVVVNASTVEEVARNRASRTKNFIMLLEMRVTRQEDSLREAWKGGG